MTGRRVALAVGDTPGHFYPALAVKQSYERLRPGTEVVFFGPAGDGMRLAAQHRCRYQRIAGSPLVRVGVSGILAAGPRALIGFVQARRSLRTLGTDLVVGFGGYSSGPVLLAARFLGIRTAIHEGNSCPGLANRLLTRAVDRVYLSRPVASWRLPADRVRMTGWPVRAEVAARASGSHRPPQGRTARVFVFGGAARGSAFLAREVPALMARLASGGVSVEVLHQTGDEAAAAVAAIYRGFGIAARVVPEVDDMGAAYAWADFAVARAGAGTLAELAIAGLPSLLVPLGDAAGDHQSRNAQAFSSEGAAFSLREDTWTVDAAAEPIGGVLMDPSRWLAMSAAALRLAAPDAADVLVKDCELLLDGRP